MRNIHTHQCTQMLMIKTWPGGTGANGYVRNSIFENFQAYDTTYALDIDQYWYGRTEPNTGAIAISDLVFRSWTGTVNNGISRGPIVIRGSNVVPLTNITLEDFNMWTENKNAVVHRCNNVYGTGYCARELKDDATTPTSFSSTVTVSTMPTGFVKPTRPAWGVGATGYGVTVPIPVYTPAPRWGYGQGNMSLAARGESRPTFVPEVRLNGSPRYTAPRATGGPRGYRSDKRNL